jgi:hypothetical protein
LGNKNSKDILTVLIMDPFFKHIILSDAEKIAKNVAKDSIQEMEWKEKMMVFRQKLLFTKHKHNTVESF